MAAERPTIIDVARVAGTSKSVVSRVTTGKGPVKDETRARVLAAMDALGYQLNPAARSLVSGRTGTVGLLLRNARSDFYAALFTQLQDQASRSGGRLVATTGNMVLGSERPALENLLELGVDALVVGSGTLPVGTISRVADRVPTVAVTQVVRDTAASSVYDDPVVHADECVGRLWDLGHRSVALFDYRGSLSARPRVQAIRRAANDRGLRLSTFEGGYDLHPGRMAGKAWLEERTGETALLFLSFEAALGAMSVLQAAGVDIPGEVSVVAADVFHFANPYLPSVSGTSRDEKVFADHVWREVTARLGDRRDHPREVLVPVSWQEGTTLGPVP